MTGYGRIDPFNQRRVPSQRRNCVGEVTAKGKWKRDGSNLDARVMDKNGGEKERERRRM